VREASENDRSAMKAIKTTKTMRRPAFTALLIFCFLGSAAVTAQDKDDGSSSTTNANDNAGVVPFGRIEMQMRSRDTSTKNEFLFQGKLRGVLLLPLYIDTYPSEATENDTAHTPTLIPHPQPLPLIFSFEVLSQTGHFLDTVLTKEFKGTAYSDFSHVTLNVDDFGIETVEVAAPTTAAEGGDDAGGSDGVLTTTDAFVYLKGNAIFVPDGGGSGGSAVPTSDVVYEIVNRAFQDENTFFLELLTTSESALLREITFAIVTVNDQVVAQAGSIDDENSNSTASEGGEDADEGTGGLQDWMIIVIAIAGVCGCIVLAFVIWACRMSKEDAAVAQQLNQYPANAKRGKSTSRTASASRDYASSAGGNSRNGGRRHEGVVVITTSTTDGGESGNGNGSSRHSGGGSPTTTLSPLHSITSQASSVFTYNPTSKGSHGGGNTGGATGCTGSTKSFFGNSFCTNNSTVEMDVEAWRRGSTLNQNDAGVGGSLPNVATGPTVIPFGHDISAIDHKRDLSLIEEGEDESALTPQSHSTNGSKRSRNSRGSRNSYSGANKPKSLLNDLQPRRLSQQAVSDLDRHDRASRGSKIDLKGSASEVIDDLNDLSAQIDDYRRR